MKKVTIFVFLFLSISVGLQAQQQLFPGKGTLLLKFLPANIFNPEFSTLDFASSYYVTDKCVVEIRFGQKIGFLDRELPGAKYDGFKIFADIQRVVSRKLSVAAEIGFSTNDDIHRLKYWTAADERMIDHYRTTKTRYSFTPKIIMALNRRGRFLIEGFGGIGLKRVHKSVSELEFDESNGDRDLTEYESLISDGLPYKPYARNRVRISLGLNICFLSGWKGKRMFGTLSDRLKSHRKRSLHIGLALNGQTSIMHLHDLAR